MCLILFAYRRHPSYELVVAANRDEFYARPTAPMAVWPEPHERVLAGRDLRAGGTWLGVTRDGRFAAITNYRSPQEVTSGSASRGLLVSEFLSGDKDAGSHLADLSGRAHHYEGFNLLVADRSGLAYYSNRGAAEVIALPPGVYGLSNHLLDTDWPKVARGKARLAELLDGDREPDAEELLELLVDSTSPPEEALPDTGVGPDLERRLGPIFIAGPDYGTRSSTALLLRAGGGGRIVERTHAIGEGPTVTRGFDV